MKGLDKTTLAFGLSAAVVMLLNSLMVILKESYHPFFEFLTSLSGNHWASQGVIDVVLFFVLGVVFSKWHLKAGLGVVVGSAVVSFCLIIGYFAPFF